MTNMFQERWPRRAQEGGLIGCALGLLTSSFSGQTVGVRMGTTGDLLVQQEFPRAKRTDFKTDSSGLASGAMPFDASRMSRARARTGPRRVNHTKTSRTTEPQENE